MQRRGKATSLETKIESNYAHTHLHALHIRPVAKLVPCYHQHCDLPIRSLETKLE
jgi:hypothetical protein